VDPAGIVFYPRYFEMVLKCFPDVPIGRAPVGVKTQFLKPNRLGDRLTLHYESGSDSWKVTGRMDDRDHFSMTSLDGDESPGADADPADSTSFQTNPEIVGEWMSDRSGHMTTSRYFEAVNMAIEEWFEESLDMPFHELHVGRRVGIPTVQFVTRIDSLPATGEAYSIRIRPTKLGGRSMSFTSRLVCGDTCLVKNEQVVVFVRMKRDGYESIEIPGFVRDAFASRLQEGT
jgi:acyl-CoA thioesterase FadM